MEVRTYLRTIFRNWPILLAGVLITVAATAIFTFRQPRVYESRSTFVIRPHSSLILQDEFVSTLDTLSRRVEINNTFAEVTNSTLIKDRAAEQLGLTSEQRRGLSADGRVLVGTNILELTVRGNDPEVARDFAEAVSVETVNYVSSLYDVFELGQLDAATLETRPVSPNYGINIALGLVLGLILGLVLIFLYEYLRSPGTRQHSFEIIDPDTGIYNLAYLEMRLGQEISRARRSNGQLSLALIRLRQHGGQGSNNHLNREAMPSVAMILDPLLRDEDLLARFDDSTFAMMLPEMSGPDAQEVVEKMRLRLGSATVTTGQFETVTGLRGAAGVAELSEDGSDAASLINNAADALREAERGTYGRVILRTTAPADSAPKTGAVYHPQPVNSGALASAASHGAATNGVTTHGPSKQVEQPAAVQAPQKPPLTRAALKLAQQYGIDPDDVEGSGKDGRVLKSDIQAVIRASESLNLSTQ